MSLWDHNNEDLFNYDWFLVLPQNRLITYQFQSSDRIVMKGKLNAGSVLWKKTKVNGISSYINKMFSWQKIRWMNHSQGRKSFDHNNKTNVYFFCCWKDSDMLGALGCLIHNSFWHLRLLEGEGLEKIPSKNDWGKRPHLPYQRKAPYPAVKKPLP